MHFPMHFMIHRSMYFPMHFLPDVLAHWLFHLASDWGLDLMFAQKSALIQLPCPSEAN
jgi:hypothetical protein